MKVVISIFVVVLVSISAIAQRHDLLWISASSSQSASNKIDFNNGNVQIDTFYPNIYSETSLISISDTAGNLQFITNGFSITDSTLQTMDNGDGLNPNLVPQGFAGHPLPQGYLVLPSPGYPINTKYSLLHFFIEIDSGRYPYFFATELRSTSIDMTLNNGLGAVDSKNEVVLEADFDGVALKAVQHGNGRDWWIVAPGRDTNIFYRFLLDPQGVHFKGTQTVDSTFYQGIAQAWFTPNGEKLVIYCLTNSLNVPNAQFIDIYDFNRCTGLLSNHTRITDNQGSNSGGMAISPNSRFFYVGNTYKIWQYDLEEADLISSKTLVAEYDGYVTPVSGLPLDFNHFYLAPDNTIWVSSTNTEFFERYHKIENPNKKGLACNINQHSLEMPGPAGWSFPNHPRYSIGPLPCSSCDTLSLKSLPEIITQPNDLTICEGQIDSFTIRSNSFSNQYIWQILDSNSNEFIDLIDGVGIEGVSDSSLIISSDAFQNLPKVFRCLVFDTCGNFMISDSVELKEIISSPSGLVQLFQDQDSIYLSSNSQSCGSLQFVISDSITFGQDISYVFYESGEKEIFSICQNECGTDTFSTVLTIPEIKVDNVPLSDTFCSPYQIRNDFSSPNFSVKEISGFLTNSIGDTLLFPDFGQHITIISPGVYSIHFEILKRNQEIESRIYPERIFILSNDTTFLSENICSGEHLIVGNQVFDSTGYYEISLFNQFSCDSLIQLELTVNPSFLILRDSSYCAGDSIKLYGSLINTPGEYIFEFETEKGCDSLISYIVSENEVNFSEIDTVVYVDSFFMGIQITTDTVFKFDLINQYGCDSVVIFNVDAKTTSLVEHVLEKGLEVFPNPSLGSFNVLLPNLDGGTLELFDLVGRRVWLAKVEKGLKNFNVHLERIPTGYYYLRFSQKNKLGIGKLVLVE